MGKQVEANLRLRVGPPSQAKIDSPEYPCGKAAYGNSQEHASGSSSRRGAWRHNSINAQVLIPSASPIPLSLEFPIFFLLHLVLAALLRVLLFAHSKLCFVL